LEPSTSGTVPSERSSHRNPRTPRSYAPQHTRGRPGILGNHRNPTNNNGGELHVATSAFLIEEIERGETDVGHFLFAKNEALIRRDVVRLRYISSGYRARGCVPRQRKTQSGRTKCRYGGGSGCARVLRSLLHPWHGRILRKLL
jgi:hypothetical protein